LPGPIAGLTTNAGHEYAEQQTDNFINSQLSASSPVPLQNSPRVL
jgi:hypothetical protein